uniref:HESX homeobox 1 n=1 Tax=Cyprinus carpio TaxID=7962 RepID=A0A8C1WVB3_CYPCA
MPGIDKLPIEETLEDSPQVTKIRFVLFLMRLMCFFFQNELSAATHLTSRLLKDYEKQRFPLGGDDEVMSSTLQQFAKVIDELSSCHAVLSTQLADAMMFPITQFQERDLREIVILKEVFQIASDDHDTAVNRYSRLSKRKENEKVWHFEYSYCTLSILFNYYFNKTLMDSPKMSLLCSLCARSVRREMDSDAEATEQAIQDMKAASDPLYMPDPDPNQIPVNRNLTRKAGYLNTRYKTGLVSSAWDRQYFFTQGGNLMSQSRGDVAGGLVMDIDNCSVMAVDCDDRRFCFQITAFDGKKAVILQAESRKDCEEWIATINNISKRIYLSENPEEIAARVNQSALEAVTPSPSFQQRHESFRPSTQGRPKTGRSGSQCSVGSESPALSSLSLDSLVAPDTPIQFDIISPVSEEHTSQAKSGAQGRRTNPFGESGGTKSEESEDSILHQLFIVRFLGSMEVKATESADVIYETMRQILAARAIHNIFRMTESHLLVTCECLKLVDPQTQVTRLRFPLSSVVLCASHRENKRLFGFVLKTAGGREDGRPVTVCYVFESNNDGEKHLCEIESFDLEEQSRLIAASSRPGQPAADGQFLVLSNSQSEDSDAGEEGQKKGESDA